MDIGAATHPGYVRAGNEDALFASGDLAVFAVADGMGGHEHGEVASRLALDIVAERAHAISQAGPTELPALLHDAIQAANAAIISQARAEEAALRMGTTIVLATICGDRLYFAHIGDSRLYLLRGDLFTQLTRDHSLVQTMVDRGEITAEEAAIHPLRHQITRVVGGDEYISPEIASQSLEPGDIILLCTDGLSGCVPNPTLKTLLSADGSDQEKADTLIQSALDAGGPDNITAVAVTYQRPRPLPPAKPAPRVHHHHFSFWWSILIAALILLVFGGGAGVWISSHPDYYLKTDERGMIALYQRWPPVLRKPEKRIDDPALIPLPVEDCRPDAAVYGDVDTGIHVEGKDAGIALMARLAEESASRLLEEAKRALDAKNTIDARECVEAARRLGGDPAMIGQLDVLITQAEHATRRPAQP